MEAGRVGLAVAKTSEGKNGGGGGGGGARHGRHVVAWREN